jgi:transcriptional regulator with PAS, ATPase and Fis domain
VEEVAPLFLRLLANHSGALAPDVEPRLIEALCLYDWPFNVRELDLLARKLLVLHGTERVLRRAHLPERIRAASGATTSPDASPPVTPSKEPREVRDETELAMLVSALRVHGGNVVKAASHLGISRQRAYRLMQASPNVNWDDVRRPHAGGN